MVMDIECLKLLLVNVVKETTRNIHEFDFIDRHFLTVDIQELSWITPTLRCYPVNKNWS